ncbi:CHROMATIN REMODELING 5 isoform A [Chlorella sorokiniana]|uniref:CHROMATIN REMODELING 5 isoform A n=1 Tax=Chlorella sorokiniana TaxID=3076 RepID=A0A2P6TUH4_CHLSO|nr:CHROMATIN REMODELING 5 isoform A [Chlorella sorokiniana]|eukprot:PRW57711.1 CHROMATIN REMODELING 5 isoform A [Chlorella sorokiniana]
MSGWGAPYRYEDEEDEEEVDNDRADDEDFDVDEEMEEEGDDDEEPEYQDESEEEDEDEDLDEEEQDEEDARQLRAVARGTPLQQAGSGGSGASKRKRGEDEWQPPGYGEQAGARQASGARGGRPAAAAPRRNVVRINLRQQTAKPNYAEQSDEEGEAAPAQQRYQPAAAAAAAGNPALVAFQAAPAAGMVQQPAAVQRWQQQAAAAAPAAVPAPVDIAAAWQQPAAVPDWAAHLPPVAPAAEAHAAPPQHAQQHHYGQPQHQQYSAPAAPIPQSFQPAQPPWLRKVASASGMAAGTASKASSGSAAGAVAKPAPYRSTTPGFYAESDDEDEAESRAKRARKVPFALLPEEDLAALRDEVERVITHRDPPNAPANPSGDPWASREFFVKWARNSYLHCTWELKATCAQLPGFKRILNYIKKVEEQEARRPWLSREECELLDLQKQMEEEIVEEYKQAERIIGERHWTDGSVKYLVKWRGLPYCEATYETEAQLAAVGQGHHVREFQERERRILESRKTVDAQRRMFAEQGHRALDSQPDYLKGGTLRDYQLDGLNWMIYSWSRGQNGILADEMGLGKTVQCASMVGYLSEVQQIAGPFLVVVPLSTVPNWIREFRKWIPSVNTIVYVGDAQSREVLRAFEWETGNPMGRQYKFDALITTYEMVLKDAEVLRPIKWAYMMVDEAHRLKNDESALYKELIQWSFKNKLLVTGTPLQNNIKELWALLHFLHPEKFPDCEEFEDDYNMQDPEAVSRLHATLRPHLLRRVIKDVEKSLPPKHEKILRVGMTPLQRQYYRWILTRNFKELNKGARSQLSLLNILVELKKCCNHPFLFQSAEEEYRLRAGGDDDVATRLVVTSGKMVLLDKLLKRLQATGHRVLIFSQMVRMLDIISDLLRLRGFPHQRLDGSTPAHQRHQAMDHFNAPGSPDFAFLLSTRAGGLGINLATADTVIIFDSDWNPQNDLQAMSRAHRIGQKDTVNIYRFVTSGSVEEDILERAKQKMVLDHLVIQRMDTSGRTVLGSGGGQEQAKQMFGKEEMAAILRFGAEDLFKDDAAAEEARGQAVVEEDLDAILERAELVHDTGEAHGQAPGRMGELLGQFSVATFKTNEDDAAFWSRLIPEDQRPKQQTEVLEAGTRASRMRQPLDQEVVALAFDDAEPKGAGGAAYHPGGGKKKKGGVASGTRGGGPQPGPPVEGAIVRVDIWPPEVDSVGNLVGLEHGPRPAEFPQSLTKKDAASFLRAVRQRGVVRKLDLVCQDTGGALEEATERARLALWYGLHRACQEAVRLFRETSPAGSLTEGSRDNKKGPKPPEAKLDWFGVEVRAQELLDQLRQWKLVERRISALAEPLAETFRLAKDETPALTQWMRSAEWSAHEDSMLMLGAWRHGNNAWDKISEDADLGLAEKLQVAVADQIKSSGKDRETRERHALAMARIVDPNRWPKASHLETRVLGILREVEKAHLKPSKPAGGGSAVKTRAASRPPLPPGGGRTGPGTSTRISPADAFVKHAAAHQAAAAAHPRDEFYAKAEETLGPDTLVLVRKIRTLQRKGGEMDPRLVQNKSRKYLGTVGDRIVEVCGGDAELRSSLWDFVSKYTEHSESGEELERDWRRFRQEGGPSREQTPQPSSQPVAPPPAQQAEQQAKREASGPPEEGELVAGAAQQGQQGTQQAQQAAGGLVKAESAEEGELPPAAASAAGVAAAAAAPDAPPAVSAPQPKIEPAAAPSAQPVALPPVQQPAAAAPPAPMLQPQQLEPAAEVLAAAAAAAPQAGAAAQAALAVQPAQQEAGAPAQVPPADQQPPAAAFQAAAAPPQAADLQAQRQQQLLHTQLAALRAAAQQVAAQQEQQPPPPPGP